MTIAYAHEPDLSVTEFREILVASTLGERRPIHDLPRLETMLRRADLIITARDGARMVGISRAVTDFSYCCYLSDLAVDVAYQRHGIGRKLIDETRARAGETTRLVLVSAPAAVDYYPKIGMAHVPSCWSLP